MSSIAAGVAIDAHQKTKNIYRAVHGKENPYTVISNKLLRDNTIKLADIGLLAQILSWSDYHNICIKALTKKCLEGREAIRNSLDRLIQAGYIRMVQTRSSDGTFDKVIYQVYEDKASALKNALDMTGTGVEQQEDTLQMDLFGDENMQDTAIGFSDNGKVETNKYLDSRSNENNNNNPPVETKNLEQPKTKADLLKVWHKDLNDPVLKGRLGIAGLLNWLVSQEQLDQYLIDFNQQHERYKHLTENQRLNNFLSYLNKIRYSKHEYFKHLARLRAHGFNVNMPQQQKKPKNNEKLQAAIQGVNPFEVKQDQGIEVDQSWLDDLKDF